MYDVFSRNTSADNPLGETKKKKKGGGANVSVKIRRIKIDKRPTTATVSFTRKKRESRRYRRDTRCISKQVSTSNEYRRRVYIIRISRVKKKKKKKR